MYNKGDVLKVNRGIYFHYGVYAGEDRVVHFSAPKGENETNPLTANICEVSLEDFAKGGEPEVDTNFEPAYEPDEIVERARLMIGTQLGRYNLVGNNCEHFANWCKTGNTKSSQSKAVGEVLRNLSETAGKLVSAFEEIRSDSGQKCYDSILAGTGPKLGNVGKIVKAIKSAKDRSPQLGVFRKNKE